MSLVDFVLRSRLSHLRSSGELYRDQWWKFCDSRQAAQRSCRELLQESREFQERFLDRWRDPAALLEDVPPQRLRNDALFYAKYSRAERIPKQAHKTMHTSFEGLAGWYYVELTSFAYVLAQICKRSGRMHLTGEYVQEGLLGIKECPTDALRDEHACGRLLALLAK